MFMAIDLTHFLHCSEILYDMHDTYITRDELFLLNGGRWVNSVVCVRFRLGPWSLYKKHIIMFYGHLHVYIFRLLEWSAE